MVWNYHEELNILGKRNNVRLFWVPGHTIDGNEKADELAKQVAVNIFYGPEPALGITKGSARRIIKDWVKSIWENTHQWTMFKPN